MTDEIAKAMEAALARPQVYAVKIDGRLAPVHGMAIDDERLRGFFLARNGYISCGNLDCDCRRKAMAKHFPNVQVVPVELTEVVD